VSKEVLSKWRPLQTQAFENRPSKIVFVTFSLAGSVADALAIYGIIW
jgi:hypothetical protein